MTENIKYFPVNWIEGMKINKNHFIELQNNLEDSVRDSRNLEINSFNFGFLSSYLMKPFQYTISIDAHNELSVDIKNLKAVTPSGGRIEITDYTGFFSEKLELKDIDSNNNHYFLMLNVDPYNRIPTGEQQMEEIPPRFPFALTKYFLTYVVEDEVNHNNIGAMQFPIAKFKSYSSKFEILPDYIPPSLTVNGHKKLITLFEEYDMFFKQLEFNSVQIIQKIKFRNNNDDKNLIAEMINESCDKILKHVELYITKNKWVNQNTKPITIFENVVTLSRILKNCFDTFSGDGKEMLFNYFSEWTDTKSGDFESLFTDTINTQYKTYDVLETVNQVKFFMSKIDNLFNILNQLDYIGKKRDTGIFVNENILKNDKISSSIFGTDNKNDDKPSSTPSFLAD